jgi:hypothetical protein
MLARRYQESRIFRAGPEIDSITHKPIFVQLKKISFVSESGCAE